MLLFLQNTGDRSSFWLRQQLILRGMEPVTITANEILTNKAFECKLTDGQYRWHIELQDGRKIESSTIKAVINRIAFLPQLFNATFRKEDADYVYQEWQAIMLSWLHSMKHDILFNRAGATGLAGERFNMQEWMGMAVKAGFSVMPYEQSHTTGESFAYSTGKKIAPLSMICYDGNIFYEEGQGSIPGSVKESAIRLQQDAGIQLIGIQLLNTHNGCFFVNADSHPELFSGGIPLLDRISDNISQKLRLKMPAL